MVERIARLRTFLIALAALLSAVPICAQAPTEHPFFDPDEPLELTLTADFSLLKDDRRGESPERPAMVTVIGDDGSEVVIEAQLRTRGKFRRDSHTCSFPPLRLNLKRKQAEGTAFEGQDKLKIVGSCRPNRNSYEQLVLSEYLQYQAFQLITGISFRTRLARITYVDESGEDDPWTRFAFFIEDDEELAARLGGEVFDLEEGTAIPPGYLDPPTTAVMSVFQYMIGNTDWSAVAGHNVELISFGLVAVPVAYDFDFSGVVDAPYSSPNPTLNLTSVRDRRYRGWCWGMDMGRTLQRFWDAEADILALYEDFPYLDDGDRGRILRYVRAFFKDIETADRADRRFLRDCRLLPTTDR